MSVKPISIREMEKHSDDIYETVVVMSKRARQINQNRFMEEAIKDAENFEMGVLDEIPEEPVENYEEETKSTTQAMDEFLDEVEVFHINLQILRVRSANAKSAHWDKQGQNLFSEWATPRPVYCWSVRLQVQKKINKVNHLWAVPDSFWTRF